MLLGIGILAVLIFLGVVVIVLIMYFVGVYNNLVTLKNDIDRS